MDTMGRPVIEKEKLYEEKIENGREEVGILGEGLGGDWEYD